MYKKILPSISADPSFYPNLRQAGAMACATGADRNHGWHSFWLQAEAKSHIKRLPRSFKD